MALLLLGALGGLLGAIPPNLGGFGVLGGSERPPEFQEEVSIVLQAEPHSPRCFSRTLHDLSCFWEQPGPAEPRRFRMEYRLEQDPWQECPLRATALSPPSRGSRFWCSLPAAATVTFVPLELRVLTNSARDSRTPPGDSRTPPGDSRTPPGDSWTPPGDSWTPPGDSRTPPGVTEVTPGDSRTPPGDSRTPPGDSRTPPGDTKVTPGDSRTPPGDSRTPPGDTKVTPGDSRTPPGDSRTPPGDSRTPPGDTKVTPGDSRTPPGDTEVTPGDTKTPEVTEVTPEVTKTTEVTPLFHRTVYIDQVVLPEAPQNVSVSPGGSRGELCVRWAPPPAPYLHSSLTYELALSAAGGTPKTVGVPAGRREQRVGGLLGSTPYLVRARARPDGLSYGGFWSPWSAPASATTPPDLDAVTLGLSCLLALLLLGLGTLGLLGHRRMLREKLWPPVPGPEREFEGLFSAYGGNFQLWLSQGLGSRCPSPSPSPEESPSAIEEVPGALSPSPPPQRPAPSPSPSAQATPPALPRPSASPSPSFEYTLFDPGSALLCPPPRPGHAPYANLGPLPKGAETKRGGAEPGHAPHYVICS